MISLGRNVTSFTKGDDIKPVTHVYVYYGYDSNGAVLYGEAVADTDDGRTYEVEVKTITDGTTANQIASNILIGMSGDIQYVPFTATGAELDIATEVGDTVSINGITSVFGTITYNFNKGMWADIEAVGLEQVDEFEELQSSNRVAQRIERSTEVNSARISVNADAISAEITRATGAESDLNTTLGTRITQTASEVRVDLQTYANNAVSNHAVEQQRYIRYNSNGLELGEEGSMAKATLTNTKLSFQDVNGAEKAYIGQDASDNNAYKFFVVNGHIINQLELGDHWLLVASGSDNDYRLTFKWRA